jgi:hypothetical protein
MIYLIIILAIITRFLPHFPNFAPITALAIFSAAYLPKKQAVIIPLAARFVSDIFLGFFSWPLMVAVYASHLVGVLFGLWIKKSVTSPALRAPSPISERGGVRLGMWPRIILSSLSASIIFFLITNFAFLYGYYPHSWQGILQSYINGLPFFRGTLLGDLSYTLVLFGSYELARYLIRQKSRRIISKNLA